MGRKHDSFSDSSLVPQLASSDDWESASDQADSAEVELADVVAFEAWEHTSDQAEEADEEVNERVGEA